MTNNTEALAQLVDALITSTRAGSTTWEVVDAQGGTFLASRPGGTVLIKGPMATGMGSVLGVAQPIKLEVKNSKGVTLERAEWGGVAAGMIGIRPIPGLRELWDLVAANRAASAVELQKLAREFS
ncbi:MAG TPA: hypothetical protein VN672_09235 [Solirubrobacteraceae bacterium]|nr:hypothetical protein [Solirubrobacteraceae bacterium]